MWNYLIISFPLPKEGLETFRVILFVLSQHDPWLYCECGGGFSGERTDSLLGFNKSFLSFLFSYFSFFLLRLFFFLCYLFWYNINYTIIVLILPMRKAESSRQAVR